MNNPFKSLALSLLLLFTSSILFAQEYPCEHEPDYVLVKDKKNYFLKNKKTKQSVLLAAQAWELDQKISKNQTCTIKTDDFVRFKVGKKVGLMQFPSKVILKAEYKNIWETVSYFEGFLLQTGKKTYRFYLNEPKRMMLEFVPADKYEALAIDNGKCYTSDNQVFLAQVGHRSKVEFFF